MYKTFVCFILLFLFGYIPSNGLTLSTDSYNIAIGQNTEQGPRDYCRIETICHPSNLAVNGDTAGNVSGGQCAHTTGSADKGSWWKVDFGARYYLSLIRIFRRSDWYKFDDRLQNFQIDGFVNATVMQTIYTDGIITTYYNNTVIDITIPLELRNEVFRGIQVSVPSHLLTLCEVQVFLAPNCSVPKLQDGTVIMNSQTKISDVVPSGASLKLSCNRGFVLNLDTEFLLCEDNGWNTYVLPICSVISCGSVTQSIQLSNGIWKPADNDCAHYLSVSCGPVDPHLNGAWIPKNGTGGYNCTHVQCEFVFECNVGHKQTISGNIITVCTEIGNWSKPQGMCEATVRCLDSKGLSAVEGGLIGAGMVLLVLLIAIIAYKILQRLRNHTSTNYTYETNSFDRNDAQPYCSIVSTKHSESDITEPQICSTTVQQNNHGMYANTNMTFDKDINLKTMQIQTENPENNANNTYEITSFDQNDIQPYCYIDHEKRIRHQ